MEQSIILDIGNVSLEGLVCRQSPERAAIVSHPHPLYGGDMYNPVVETIARAFQEKGYSTLRFNFRGTGRSSGSHDDGRGEQDDILAAHAWLTDEGYRSIVLVGYSFGARINAGVVSGGCPVKDHIMVSPPVAFMSFDDIAQMPNTGFIVSGDRDEYAPVGQIEAQIKKWGIAPRYEKICQCDHFYSGCLEELRLLLLDYLS